jgi:predicted nucleic acid-binding protein
MTKKIIVDADAIYAVYNHNDPLHGRAIRILRWLSNNRFQLVYPTSVIFEVMSLFQRVLKTSTVTAKLVDMISRDLLIIHDVDSKLLKQSIAVFKPAGNKKNTLVDCSVVALAKKLKADGVFSYDRFYIKQGLKLAEELVVDN